MRFKIIGLTLVLGFISIIPATSNAQVFGFQSLGLRFGFPQKGRDSGFKQYEIAAVYSLPWGKQWDSGWQLGTRLNMTAGALRKSGDTGFIGSLGPGISIGKNGGRFVFDLGIRATVLSKHEFSNKDLGGPMQFTSHAGLTFQFHRRVSAGYSFQHMSNSSLYNKNPGLNMHVITVSYRF